MGKVSQHRRHNWKSREIVETIIDDTEQRKIKVDFEHEDGGYDACNALVLPSAKRKTKKLRNKNAPVKLLSNKQRKKLMKINEKKLRKIKREDIIEQLKNVQAKPKDMAVLTSLQTTQTLGHKKFLNPLFTTLSEKEDEVDKDLTNHLKWKVPKAVKREIRSNKLPVKKFKDFNVVESESSSCSSDESGIDTDDDNSKPQSVADEESKGSGETDVEAIKKNHHEKAEDSNETHVIEAMTEDTPRDKVTEGHLANGEFTKTSSKFVKVERDPEVQKHRLKLPILSEEHTVMEAINENLITLIVGQTGSGKTTQVPQFLYEAGYASQGKMIGVTEPRRVAAISMSERVGYEMGFSTSKVSYQIRFEGNTTPDTQIKFMTDGVLFKEVLQSPLLENYSAIVIDEAHERSVHSDILIGLLSRIVPRRKKKGKELKLIIMSATLRIDDFINNPLLFKNKPPVIHIQPRMFDVTIYFNKETDPDYCSAAYRKICKIHRQLPDGGILVFLTGQQEIKDLCKQLKATFPCKDLKNKKMSSFRKRLEDKKEKRKRKKSKVVDLPEVNLKDFSSPQFSKEDNPEDEDDLMDDVSTKFLVDDEQPLWVLPLYALLPRHKQVLVFEPPPEGTRLCVVATNVAETSLTIPNIKYVVDSGMNKDKIYDPVTGVSTYHINRCSKASANQRSGRAGRTSEGFCYRLYSSAVFNDEFPEYSAPDIQKRPLDEVVLTMKALKIPVVNFPFPSPPDVNHLNQSIKRLIILGALKESEKLIANKGKLKKNNLSKVKDVSMITEMGSSMAALPVAPRFAKMILYCHQHQGILPYVILIIAALSVQEVLIEIPLGSKKLAGIQKHWEYQRMKWGGTGASHLLGDLLVLINVVLEAETTKASFRWCRDHGIRHAALMEIRKLRRQLTNEINLLVPESNLIIDPNMKPPTDKQACIISEVVVMGSLDQIARRVESYELAPEQDKKVWKNAYRTLYSEKPVYISSASVLHKKQPKFVMYQDIYESTKVFLRGITVVDEAWLIQHGGSLVDLSPPLDTPQPSYNALRDEVVCWRSGAYGPDKWPLSEQQVTHPITKDLFKWIAYFFLIGELWPPLKEFVQYLYDPKTLLSPISLRYRDKRENIIRAFMVKNITSKMGLKGVWKKDPHYLQAEYFAWFEKEEKLGALRYEWPPALKEHSWFS